MTKSVDRRTEPRFSISAPVKVTLLSSLEREIDCRVVDLSATGMRLIAGEAIPAGEMVAVDFEDHLAVATVRNCQRYGDKFSVGTSRIHELPKDQLPSGQPRYQQIRALLEEKGWSVEIETDDPVPEAPAAPEPAREAETEAGSQAPLVEAGPAADEAAPVTANEPVTEIEPGAEIETLAASLPMAGLVTQPLNQPVAQLVAQVMTEAPPSAPASSAPPVPVVPTALPPKAPAQDTEPADPVRTLRHAAPPVTPAPASRRGLLTAAMAALVVVAGLIFLGLQHRASAPDSAAAVAPVLAAAPSPVAAAPGPVIEAPKPAAPSPAPAVAAVTNDAQPTAAPVADLHHVRLAISNPSWISATADGKTVLSRLFNQGDVHDFQFSKVAFVHVGNSANVELSLDGKAVHLAGDSGPLRLVEITPDGARILPWTNGDPPSASKK
jgi:hypothetical protein